MNAIGGYFGLELCQGNEYHSEAIKLNMARNALEYVLRTKKHKKLYLPYFTCHVVLQPVKRLNIKHEFYHIDKHLEPIFDFNQLNKNDAFLYVNYFGLKDRYVEKLAHLKKNIIIDNSQAFFSQPVKDMDTFYCPRKFFGVPDGSYLYTGEKLNNPLKQDVSHPRFKHLLKRIDLGAEAGYGDFHANDASLDDQEIKKMSNLTQNLLQSINYKQVAETRRQNFKYIKNKLDKHNQLKVDIGTDQVPLIYPFLTNNAKLKNYLIQNKIYVASYWPNVLSWTDKNSFEHRMTSNMVSIPIDQRYGKKEMDRILDVISEKI